jgi:hypothetical protein
MSPERAASMRSRPVTAMDIEGIDVEGLKPQKCPHRRDAPN